MPADWGQYGRAAGMIRNRNMCRKGAYLCVAFLDWCRAPGCNAVPTAATGVSNCASDAEAAGIETGRYYTPEEGK
jgi:hypothetical protein